MPYFTKPTPVADGDTSSQDDVNNISNNTDTAFTAVTTDVVGIKDGSLLETNSIVTTHITDLNVTEVKLATGAVTTTKLGTDSVTTVKITDENVTEPKLDAMNAPADSEVLSYNTTAGRMEWIANGAGIDTYKVRLGDATSAIDFLGNVLGTGLEISGVAPNEVLQVTASVGDVNGPGSSVDNNISTFNGTTGKVIKDSGVAISSLLSGPGSSVDNNIPTFNGTTGKTIQDSGESINSLKAQMFFIGGW